MGGALGILVAYSGQELLPAPIGSSGTFDVRALAAMTAVTALVGVAFGIAPALQATRIDIGTSLKESSRSVTGSNSVLSRSLLVAQVSISLVLLVGAGLFLRTLDNLQRVDVGYDPSNLVFVRTLPNTTEYDTPVQNRLLSRWHGAAPGRAGRTRGDGVDADAAVGQHEHAPACSCRAVFIPRPRLGTTDRHQPRRRRAELLRDDGHSARRRPPSHGQRSRQRRRRSRSSTRPPRGSSSRTRIRSAGALEFGREHRATSRSSACCATSATTVFVEPPPPTLYVPYVQRGPEGLIFTVRTAGDPAALMPAIRRGGERHQSRDSGRHGRNADVSDRAEVRPGEGAGAGIRALRRHRAYSWPPSGCSG